MATTARRVEDYFRGAMDRPTRLGRVGSDYHKRGVDDPVTENGSDNSTNQGARDGLPLFTDKRHLTYSPCGYDLDEPPTP